MKKKRYFWQPELSISIIYWSVTFFILFVSLIVTMEHTTLYWKTYAIMAVFLVFLCLGLHRYFQLEQTGIKAARALLGRAYFIEYQQIQQVILGEKDICFITNQGKSYYFVMKKKSLELFFAQLEPLLVTQTEITYKKTATLSE